MKKRERERKSKRERERERKKERERNRKTVPAELLMNEVDEKYKHTDENKSAEDKPHSQCCVVINTSLHMVDFTCQNQSKCSVKGHNSLELELSGIQQLHQMFIYQLKLVLISLTLSLTDSLRLSNN